MHGITLQQLRYFDAVVAQGSFHAAANRLHRSHPTVCAAVATLEQQLGFALLDRKGYRVALTHAGRSFHERVKPVLQGAEDLQRFAEFIARGERMELRIVIDDSCIARPLLLMLNDFFSTAQIDKPQLRIESSVQPATALLECGADLLFQAGNMNDTRLDYVRWRAIEMVPVVAPGVFRTPVGDITCEQLKTGAPRCLINDRFGSYEPAAGGVDANKLVLATQQLKHEAILQRMGWGYLPSSWVVSDLRAGRLISLAGRHLRSSKVQLWAARPRGFAHGALLDQLWQHLQSIDAETTAAVANER